MRLRASIRASMAMTAIVLTAGVAPAQAGHIAHDDACTALHEAAFLDEPDEARDLLTHGADVNCLDVLGQTPLITAVNGASMATFDLLLAAGAKVDVRTEFGLSVLAHARKKSASFSTPDGENFRTLYSTIIARLQGAGAVR